jgi:hypothetical protein
MLRHVDGRRQRLQTRADLRMQHLAAAQIGQEAVAPLAKADQGAALLDDVTHTEPRLAPIAPGLGGERIEPAFGRHLADALQDVFEAVVLDTNLGLGVQMLERAAAADAEVGASGFDAVGRGRQYFLDLGFVEATLDAGVAQTHALAGQRAIDEHGLTVDAGQAAAFMGQGLDVGLDGRGECFGFSRHGRVDRSSVGD